MKFKFRENKYYSLMDLALGMIPEKSPVLEEKYHGVIYTGTARAALKIILDFLKSRGRSRTRIQK